MVLLIGPFVAAVGLVAVFFVMRHRSVQTKSMYSARRGQIERKVRAARQRTLAPTGKHAADAAAAPMPQDFATPGMEAKTAIPTATWGPPTARPEQAPPPVPEQTWEVGPTVPAPKAPEVSPASYAPSEAAPPPVAPESEWTPARIDPVVTPQPEPTATPAQTPVSTPAGGGAAWSIIGDSKAGATEEPAAKKGKKDKKDKHAHTPDWQLASGDLPGSESAEEVRGPSTAVALAQYAVLVVGLIMVLIGVLVMVANSHFT